MIVRVSVDLNRTAVDSDSDGWTEGERLCSQLQSNAISAKSENSIADLGFIFLWFSATDWLRSVLLSDFMKTH